MFSKLAISSILAFAFLAAATPNPISSRQDSTCSTGPVQCCESTTTVCLAQGS
ncbi:uncharacterized protein PHACADRAFT_252667 [Phanerochaete carnosa HHB-10118-sp]|uniref:Hydrophobin n=1 Tax=Phanerochaete carnosa (strain HHB-10118-sp) TaxID=650164 RepID=K5X6B8_PHACS|nr:uncharacterized protein PHACADRAFT_252667 [Phanerochaete carnosa HHB-10118-sp]EKM58387.1 hypothetical protein PHACADRAFT_252667 [Phanerochaete carnosa HHB-10118-sp]